MPRTRRRLFLVALPVLALLSAGLAWVSRPPTTASAAVSIAGLHVSGNKIVNSANQTVTLWGVNRSGGEYSCIAHSGFPAFAIFDGPMDDPAVTAIASWSGVNAVRVPLNEDCWLGKSNIPPELAGTNYITAVRNYVNLLHQHGLVAVLDLHWTDGEEEVRLDNTATVTALTITIVVQRTQGVTFSGQYNTVGGQITQSNSSTASAITYTFGLAPGQTLSAGSGRLFAAQMSGTATTHVTTADTFSVTATSGGTTTTTSGHF